MTTKTHNLVDDIDWPDASIAPADIQRIDEENYMESFVHHTNFQRLLLTGTERKIKLNPRNLAKALWKSLKKG